MLSPPSSSFSLIDRVKLQDPEAWRTLVTIYGPTVLDWGRKYDLQPADAADVMQDVFLAVSSSINNFRHENANSSFRGWLWTVFRNKAIDHLRKRNQEPRVPGGTEFGQLIRQIKAEDRDSSLSDTPERDECVRRALLCIQKDFKEATWQAFWRTVVCDHRPIDVANDLGMKPSSVCMCRSRVLKRLREIFAEFEYFADWE